MRNFVRHKFQAGALQFTVFISVLIALLLAGALLLAYTHRYFRQQSHDIINNIQLADSGIAYLSTDKDASADTIVLKIPGMPQEQLITANLSHWGIFEKAFVTASHRKKRFTKCALLGSWYSETSRPALYLQETFKPLALVGTTKIIGNAVIPKQGVKPGNISGNNFYGSRLMQGALSVSDTVLPKLRYNYTEIIQRTLLQYEPAPDEYIGITAKSKIINLFTERTKGLFSSDEIILRDIWVQGNIIIRSDKKITISSNAVLKDVILIAPDIEIEAGTIGHFQAFAQNKIRVGENCRLIYPSALILVENKNLEPNPNDLLQNQIYIDKSSIVNGSICYFSTKPSYGYKLNIYTAPSARIKGEIYCEGNLELRGTVAGTVYAKHLIVNEGGSIFVNHLYNAEIDSGKLQEVFGGILFDDTKKTTMKWLY
jgi:hypothetical protein